EGVGAGDVGRRRLVAGVGVGPHPAPAGQLDLLQLVAPAPGVAAPRPLGGEVDGPAGPAAGAEQRRALARGEPPLDRGPVTRCDGRGGRCGHGRSSPRTTALPAGPGGPATVPDTPSGPFGSVPHPGFGGESSPVLGRRIAVPETSGFEGRKPWMTTDLTKSEREALKAIYRFTRDGSEAHTGALAERLGLSPGTVTTLVKRLADRGLVDHRPYQGVTFTEKGRRAA